MVLAQLLIIGSDSVQHESADVFLGLDLFRKNENLLLAFNDAIRQTIYLVAFVDACLQKPGVLPIENGTALHQLLRHVLHPFNAGEQRLAGRFSSCLGRLDLGRTLTPSNPQVSRMMYSG